MTARIIVDHGFAPRSVVSTSTSYTRAEKRRERKKERRETRAKELKVRMQMICKRQNTRYKTAHTSLLFEPAAHERGKPPLMMTGAAPADRAPQHIKSTQIQSEELGSAELSNQRPNKRRNRQGCMNPWRITDWPIRTRGLSCKDTTSGNPSQPPRHWFRRISYRKNVCFSNLCGFVCYWGTCQTGTRGGCDH